MVLSTWEIPLEQNLKITFRRFFQLFRVTKFSSNAKWKSWSCAQDSNSFFSLNLCQKIHFQYGIIFFTEKKNTKKWRKKMNLCYILSQGTFLCENFQFNCLLSEWKIILFGGFSHSHKIHQRKTLSLTKTILCHKRKFIGNCMGIFFFYYSYPAWKREN